MAVVAPLVTFNNGLIRRMRYSNLLRGVDCWHHQGIKNYDIFFVKELDDNNGYGISYFNGDDYSNCSNLITPMPNDIYYNHSYMLYYDRKRNVLYHCYNFCRPEQKYEDIDKDKDNLYNKLMETCNKCSNYNTLYDFVEATVKQMYGDVPIIAMDTSYAKNYNTFDIPFDTDYVRQF